MNDRDRRVDPRLDIRVPLRVRQLSKAGCPELFTESENLSQRGIYFATKVPLEVGTLIEVTLRMPKELLGQPPHIGNFGNDVTCTARVVHVRPGSFLGGKAGIGVHIERYQAAVLEPERWAS